MCPLSGVGGGGGASACRAELIREYSVSFCAGTWRAAFTFLHPAVLVQH
jgi:hypothetical protein